MEFKEGEDMLLVAGVDNGEASVLTGDDREIATYVAATTPDSECNCEQCSWGSGWEFRPNQDALVTLLSGCSRMRKFRVYDGRTSFPAQLLARIISQQQGQLKHIEVCTINAANNGTLDLVGTSQDFTELASAVRTNLTSLKSCALEICVAGHVSYSDAADGLMWSLLGVPTLTFLHLGSSFRSIRTLEEMISPSLLIQACLSPNLVTLNLQFIKEKTLVALLKTLVNNNRLEEFFILCMQNLSIAGARAAGRLIRSNRTLKKLDLAIDVVSDNNEALMEMISALEVSSSLETFAIDDYRRRDWNIGIRKATNVMFQKNTTLKEFSLGWKGSEENFPKDCKDFCNEVQYYLNLNKAGRGSLGSAPSKEQLVKSLEAANDDIPCLFFFLSKYPSLFHLTDPTRVAYIENPRKKRRRLYRAAKYNPVAYR